MQRTSSVKKHTRSVKETVVIYLIGVSICVYLGFLCGAVWISGNDFNEFMNNFQSFVIDGHHYIVGVTSATWKFVLVYLIGWSMAFIIIFTKLSIPLPERNMAGQDGEMPRNLPDSLQIMTKK